MCMKACSLALLAMAVGCTSTLKVHVVDLNQGNDGVRECPTGEAAYVWPEHRVAVCWPEKVVAYVACVEHLTLSERDASSVRKSELDLALKVLDKAEASAKYTKEQIDKVIEKFEATGDIAKARADSILACQALVGISRKEVAALPAGLQALSPEAQVEALEQAAPAFEGGVDWDKVKK